MSTHNLCFGQKYEKYQGFLSENFQFLEVKFSVYLNSHVFVMNRFVIPHHITFYLFWSILCVTVILEGYF